MQDLTERLQTALGTAYTLERELPRGGMSRVFVARENALGRRVVIKVLAPELTATLSRTLQARDLACGATPAPEHRSAACRGPSGDIALLHNALGGRRVVTRAHRPRATDGVYRHHAAYIAPEQASGDPSLDHRADIYAVGVVAYERITGHPPFRGRTPQAIMAAHARDVPEPVVVKRPDVPPHLARIVMQSLAKSPVDRPQSAGDLVRVLVPTAAAGGAPSTLSPLLRIPVWIPWLVAAISTTVAVVLALR